MSILEIINLIESDKKSRNIEPHHATRIEVLKLADKYYPVCVKEIVDSELEVLQKQNVIRIGHTINDKYITVYGQ